MAKSPDIKYRQGNVFPDPDYPVPKVNVISLVSILEGGGRVKRTPRSGSGELGETGAMSRDLPNRVSETYPLSPIAILRRPEASAFARTRTSLPLSPMGHCHSLVSSDSTEATSCGYDLTKSHSSTS